MSSISREQFIERYGFDPEGTEPLGRLRGADWWLEYPEAMGAARLFAGKESDFWLEWLGTSGLVPVDWRPEGDLALVQLWDGVLRANDAGMFRPCDWAEIEGNPPVPLWLRLAPSMEKVFGVQGCRLVAAVIAGVSKWMEAAWGAHWKPVEPQAGEPALAVLRIPGSTSAVPYQQLPSAVGGVIRGEERDLDASALVEWVHLFEPGGELASIAGVGAEEDDDGAEFGLSALEAGRWGLAVDDWTAHFEEERYERLTVLLGESEGIQDCIHEDRELILFRSELDHDTLLALVKRLWESTTT
jgi:hypothetical protein